MYFLDTTYSILLSLNLDFNYSTTKMLTPHTSAAIAQTVFYAPVVPVCFYIVIRNWPNRPRQAWFPFLAFSLSKIPLMPSRFCCHGRIPKNPQANPTGIVRFVGGILVILQASKPTDIGLIIASIILLNVGVIPLMVSTLGLIRLM